MDLRAVESLYDAIVEPELWPAVMDRFAHALGAKGCLFYPTDPAALGIASSSSIQDFVTTFMRDQWYLQDPRASRGWQLAFSGRTVLLDHDIASMDERRSIPMYQEIMTDFGLPWWAGLTFKVNGSWWGLSLLKGMGTEPYDLHDAKILQRIVPEVRKIVSLSERAGNSRTRAALYSLQQISCPAFLVSPSGKVRDINSLAEKLFQDDLAVINGSLIVRDHSAGKILQDFLRQKHRLAGVNDVVCVRIGTRDLLFEFFAMKRGWADVFSNSDAIVTVTELRKSGTPSAYTLIKAFGLTRAEAAVAIALAKGRTLEEIGNEFQTSIETVRVQLKAAFSKAEVNRQTDLVRLVLQFRNRDSIV